MNESDLLPVGTRVRPIGGYGTVPAGTEGTVVRYWHRGEGRLPWNPKRPIPFPYYVKWDGYEWDRLLAHSELEVVPCSPASP